MNYHSPTAILAVFWLAGCASYGSVDGVDNLWRDIPADQFAVGVTTQSDVLDLLGPPSQLINLQDLSLIHI